MDSKKLSFVTLLVVGFLMSQWVILSILTDGIKGAYLPLAVLSITLIPLWPKLSTVGLIVFSGASLQLPLPMKPQLWMLMAVLAIPSILISMTGRSLAFDRYADRKMWSVLLSGILLYVTGMVVSAAYNDISPNEMLINIGSREYIKHIIFIAAVSGLALIKVTRKEIEVSIKISWLLAITYAVTDIVLYTAPSLLPYFKLFFNIPTDFNNFSAMERLGMVRRLEGVGLASIGFGCWVISQYRPDRNSLMKGFLLLAIIAAIVGVGASGFRRYLPILPMAFVFSLHAQGRLFSFGNVLLATAGAIIVIGGAYLTVNSLPLPVQRTLQVLPGMESVTDYNFWDARANDIGRNEIKELALEELKHEWTFGRGFLHDPALTNSNDEVRFSIGIGYNCLGWLSLMYHLGILGFLGSMIMIITMFWWATKLVDWYRKNAPDDPFAPAVGVITGVLFYTLLYYMFSKGNGLHFFKSAGPPLYLLIFADRARAKLKLEQEEAYAAYLQAEGEA